MMLATLFTLCALTACGPDYHVPDPVDNPVVKPGDDSGDDDSGDDSGLGGGGSGKSGLLSADGNDSETYKLILEKGYNYETPDNSGEHASAPFRHIHQRYDNVLRKQVFDFYLHIQNDDDRGKADVKDRQRNEIKTDSKSPADMWALKGETLKLSWKFCLPEGMQTSTKFSHIHQLKGIDNKDNSADVGNPLITFTCRSLSSGKQQLQVIYTAPTEDGAGTEYLAKVDLADFLGRWVSVSERVCFDDKGTYMVTIYRIDDGKKLLDLTVTGKDLWREGAAGMRPKWGLYRYFGDNRSMASQLRDEVLGFADFLVEKVK